MSRFYFYWTLLKSLCISYPRIFDMNSLEVSLHYKTHLASYFLYIIPLTWTKTYYICENTLPMSCVSKVRTYICVFNNWRNKLDGQSKTDENVTRKSKYEKYHFYNPYVTIHIKTYMVAKLYSYHRRIKIKRNTLGKMENNFFNET